MGKALYRKYRSKKLSEIVGQEHVTTALSNALKSGRIGHAYLFTGPRGVGKTSIARILAHEVNNLPYDEDATHLDIIEIDAASNRRIDEIRTLRERVHNAPTSAKYKVYIIDEVHMLTKEAFNALLKTLEEPPAHVIFILATTEAHKLPDTIISRTQRYTFKPAEPAAAAKHLAKIAKKEDIDISDEALGLVAHHGNGSFRDSISLLDQVGNTSGRIELNDVRRMLGIPPEEAIEQLINTLANGAPAELINQLQALHEQGYQAPQIAKQIARGLRRQLLENSSTLPAPKASQLMQRLLAVPAAHDPLALLEINLLDVVLAREEAASTPSKVEEKPDNNQSMSDVKKPAPKENPKPEEIPKPITPEPEPEPEVIQDVTTLEPPKEALLLDEVAWQQTLQTLKAKHNTLYGIARMAEPIFNDNELTLTFKFAFHQKRFNDAKNKKILIDTITNVTGNTVSVNCIVDKDKNAKAEPKSQPADSPKPTANHLENISNIFGSAEVID
jgi:DNA polymerase III subunit gamma/tau